MKIIRFIRLNWFVILGYYLIILLFALATTYSEKSKIEDIKNYGITTPQCKKYKIQSPGGLYNRDILDCIEINDKYIVQALIDSKENVYAIASSEEVNVPMIYGDINRLLNTKETYCIIGKNIKDIYELAGDKYISIDSVRYKVIGVMGNDKRKTGYDDIVYININSNEQLSKKVYSSWNVYIENDEDELYESLIKKSNEKDSSALIIAEGEGHNKQVNKLFSGNIMYILVFVLAVISVINNAYFWINSIVKELAIRIMLGANSIRIMTKLLFSHISIGIFSVILYMLTYYLLEFCGVIVYFSYINILIVDLFMVLSNFIISSFRAAKINLVKAIRR